MTRLNVQKTHKLFIAGQFPRSESGRSLPISSATGDTITHISRASRKDLRNAVEAARAAFPKWSCATACNRAQILYRMAEMLEGRKSDFTTLLQQTSPRRKRGRAAPATARTNSPLAEVQTTIDRLICFAGWADKYAQILGCANPVAGPYYNFTIPEPTVVVGIVAPDHPFLLGLISLLAPPLCAGNTIIALASESNPLPAAILGEVCATSDLPPGAINILTGLRDELLPHFASHRDIDALHAADLSPAHTKLLREGAADNLKRVTIRSTPTPPTRSTGTRRSASARPPKPLDYFDDACHSPWWIEPFVEFKTIWHPSAT